MSTMTDKLITHYLPMALNRYLFLDPESSSRLAVLQNKVVTIQFATPIHKKNINEFQIAFTQEGIQLKTTAFSKPDTFIKGTPLSLLRMALTNDDRKKFFSEDISIEGDLELGQQVIALFDELEIDLEEYLSQWLGDVPAHQISRFSRKIKNIGKRFQIALMQNMNEYVHEEINLFPAAEALQDFYHDVDSLRMDTDRLEIRMQQLTKKIIARRDHA